MKLTKHQLQKIIKEELNNVLKEVQNPFELKYDLVDIMRAFEKGRSKPIPTDDAIEHWPRGYAPPLAGPMKPLTSPAQPHPHTRGGGHHRTRPEDLEELNNLLNEQGDHGSIFLPTEDIISAEDAALSAMLEKGIVHPRLFKRAAEQRDQHGHLRTRPEPDWSREYLEGRRARPKLPYVPAEERVRRREIKLHNLRSALEAAGYTPEQAMAELMPWHPR